MTVVTFLSTFDARRKWVCEVAVVAYTVDYDVYGT